MNVLKINGFLMLLIILSVGNLFAQTENKEVTITSSGSGATMEDAKQAALRSAIEQAFGAFISSKTEIFNDQVVAEQMSSVSSGNIKSFEMLNQSQLPDGRWGVTLKAIISVDRLTSFVEAKGIEVEIMGEIFALNIKQQLLNEQGEIQAIAEMVGVLHETLQTSFDYNIKSSEPKSLDASSEKWEIQLVVTASANKNMDFCSDYLKNTLAAISLSSAEIESYKTLNKNLYMVTYYKKTFYLRNKLSLIALNELICNWSFYSNNFSVQGGADEFYENRFNVLEVISLGGKYSVMNSDGSILENAHIKLQFPFSGKKVGTFSYKDNRTLRQIELMSKYSVKSKGILSNFKYGGYVVFEKDGHGLVVSLLNIPNCRWIDARIACQNLVLNGYYDWRLPNKDELELINNNIFKKSIGDFGTIKTHNWKEFTYWSNTTEEGLKVWVLNYPYERFSLVGNSIGETHLARAVRNF